MATYCSPLSAKCAEFERDTALWTANAAGPKGTLHDIGVDLGAATIRCFSSEDQRRRDPDAMTSIRDTFDIVVWSVIRLSFTTPLSVQGALHRTLTIRGAGQGKYSATDTV